MRECADLGNNTDSLSDVDANSCTDTNSLGSEEDIWEDSSDEDIGKYTGTEPLLITANKMLYAFLSLPSGYLKGQ